MIIVKEYRLKPSVYVLFSLIEALEGSFSGIFPKDVEKQLFILKKKVIHHIEPSDRDFKDKDIVKQEYYIKNFIWSKNIINL